LNDGDDRSPNGVDGDGQFETFTDFVGIDAGMIGKAMANAIVMSRELRLWSARPSFRRQRPTFAMTLDESADKGRTDFEPLRDFGGRFPRVPSFENAHAKIHRNGRHRALLGRMETVSPNSIGWSL
jgi:hypothetical protein